MTTTQKISLVLANIIFWLIILFVGYSYEWLYPPFSSEDGSYYPTMLWGNFFNALVLYVNALVLYPYREKLKLSYWLLAIFLVIGVSVLEAFVDYRLIFYMGLIEELDASLAGSPRWVFIAGAFMQHIVIHFLWFVLSFAIIFLYEKGRNQKIQQALEEEKLKAELKYLRAQINPHFLFNGINSVFFLIDEKPDIAKSTLLKFSDLLRYQLYECQDETIALSKELSHIQSYVDMEKIRRGDDVSISLSLPDELGQINIAPLLFTPFLENAFKYVSNHDDGDQNKIDISFRHNDDSLYFEIENTIDDNNDIEKGGIGIDNVKKRLALLYPNKHQLDIFKKENVFVVRLILNLKT